MKYNTIIFVPHARARFRKLTISTRFLGLSAAAVAASSWSPPSPSAGPSSRPRARTAQYRMAIAENARLRSTAADAPPAPRRNLPADVGLRGPHPAPRDRGRPDRLGGRRGRRPAARRRSRPTSASRAPALLAADAARDAVLPALGPDRLDAHRLAGARRRSTRASASRADPFTGQPAFHEGVDISTVPQRAGPGHGRRHRAAQRLGRRVRHGRSRSSHGDRYTHRSTATSRRPSSAEGQTVRRGDRVGLVGSTGRSTAPHLHYEVHVDGRAVNPLEYILETPRSSPRSPRPRPLAPPPRLPARNPK